MKHYRIVALTISSFQANVFAVEQRTGWFSRVFLGRTWREFGHNLAPVPPVLGRVSYNGNRKVFESAGQAEAWLRKVTAGPPKQQVVKELSL